MQPQTHESVLKGFAPQFYYSLGDGDVDGRKWVSFGRITEDDVKRVIENISDPEHQAQVAFFLEALMEQLEDGLEVGQCVVLGQTIYERMREKYGDDPLGPAKENLHPGNVSPQYCYALGDENVDGTKWTRFTNLREADVECVIQNIPDPIHQAQIAHVLGMLKDQLAAGRCVGECLWEGRSMFEVLNEKPPAERVAAAG